MAEPMSEKRLAEIREHQQWYPTDDGRDLLAEVDRLRGEMAEVEHVLKVTGEKTDALRGQRDRLAEQVQRIRELAVYFREREADLKRRYDEATDDAKATALLSSAALTGDAAHRVERALDGTEAGR